MPISKNNWYRFIVLKDQKFLIFIVIVSLICASYLGFLTPKIISSLYESYNTTGNEKFLDAVYAMILLFSLEYINSVIYQFSINKYMQHLIQHVRSVSYSNWIRSYEVVKNEDKKFPLGEVLARIMSDTEALMELVGSGSFKIFIDVAFIVSCLISFLTLNTTSGIALILAEVIAVLALLWGSKHMGKVYLEVRKSTGIMARTVANLTAGFRDAYYTPNFNYASKTSLASFEDFLKKQLKANIWDASYFSVAESLFPLLLALLVIVFPYSHIVEMAVLAAIIDLIQRSINPVKDMASRVSSIQRARSGMVRIVEFNHEFEKGASSNFDESYRQIELNTFEVSIKHFEYSAKTDSENEKFELQDIEFKANAGDLVGIVGLSGSGKSTVLKILATEILCEKAIVKMLEKNGEEFTFSQSKFDDIAEYKHQVSMVSQDSHVFTETLEFNITLGNKTKQEFEAFWNTVILNLPYLKKWQVTPSDIIKASELSLGQKQLISALRSCFLVKPVVLFDEISSGLDSDLEASLRKLVLMIQQKSLTIIVAHRIETIIKANKILVMDKGRLESQGTNEELLRGSAVYQEFVSQLKSLH